tara:strand:- start:465 stop:596 length:132 start_codon:yes stop_codon:yes gene_type:complete
VKAPYGLLPDQAQFLCGMKRNEPENMAGALQHWAGNDVEYNCD